MAKAKEKTKKKSATAKAPKKGVGAEGKYPWDKWFSKKKFTIKKEDYSCQTTSMIFHVRRRAALRGLKVSIKNQEGNLSVEVV